MRKIVVYELLSLDGVAEAPDQFLTEWDEAMDANLAAVIGTQDTVILGRRSYDEWAQFWPDAQIEPFASFINSVPKYIATSSALETRWSNSMVIGRELPDLVRYLKSGDGGDIGVHASIEIAQSLLAEGLVDELKLVVGPVIVGSGRRLFDGLPTIPLTLTKSVTSPTGALLLDYRIG